MSRLIQVLVDTDQDVATFLENISRIFQVEIQPLEGSFGEFYAPPINAGCEIRDATNSPVIDENTFPQLPGRKYKYKIWIFPGLHESINLTYAEAQDLAAQGVFDTLKATNNYDLLLLDNDYEQTALYEPRKFYLK